MSRNKKFGVFHCNNELPKTQTFYYMPNHEIRYGSGQNCWDASKDNDRIFVNSYTCHGKGGNQYFDYDQVK